MRASDSGRDAAAPGRRRSAVIALACGLAAALLCPPATGADLSAQAEQMATADEPGAVDIREWPVPWEETRPRDPYVGPDGRVWFVGQRDDYVAYLQPETGDFRRYELDDGTGPHNLIVGDDGTVWYAGNRAAHIGKLDPETGDIQKIAMPDPEARDPHTLAFGPTGDIWFTVQGGNMVGRLDTGTEEVRLIDVPTEGARPYGIKVTSEGRPWIALLGTNKLATVDPSTMELREVELPRPDARPRRLEITSDGRIWFVDYAQGHLGVYDPASGSFEEWVTPGGTGSSPYGMASDEEDRIWFVETETSPNEFIGFDPATEEFLAATDVPSGGGTVRHMYYHAPTDAVWFGADTNTVGRASLP